MTKDNFEKTIWYRLLKTVYIISFIFTMFISLGLLWSTYDVYVSDYDVRNSSKYIEYNRDGVVGLTTQRIIKEELVKDQKRIALKNIVIFTPVIIFIVWLSFLIIRRLFFYISFGDKFLRLPLKLFD